MPTCRVYLGLESTPITISEGHPAGSHFCQDLKPDRPPPASESRSNMSLICCQDRIIVDPEMTETTQIIHLFLQTFCLLSLSTSADATVLFHVTYSVHHIIIIF